MTSTKETRIPRLPRPCRIEWHDGGIGWSTDCEDFDQAVDIIQAAYPECIIESETSGHEVGEILAWRNAQTAGLPDSAVAVIRFIES